VLADSTLSANCGAVASGIVRHAQQCPVVQRRHQLARTLMPVALLLLLADASSLSKQSIASAVLRTHA
jgi:hypothetical protein